MIDAWRPFKGAGSDTWEARMAANAAARAAVAEAEQIACDDANDPHRGHHEHLNGTSVECSCGEFFGVTTVAFSGDYDPAKLSCRICGAPGVVALTQD